MGWPRRLVLVRHGQSEGNVLSAEERASLDVPTYQYKLTELGRRQAALTGEYLRQKYPDGFDQVFSSYYDRARETARIALPGASIREDACLAEAQRGIWHTMTHAEVLARFPEEVRRKEREDFYHYRPLGGESWPDVEQRIRIFLLMLCQESEGERVCVVGHGHLFICFQRVLDRISIEEATTRYKTGHFANASVTTYKLKAVNGRARLVLEEENFVPWAGQLEEPGK